MPQPATMADVAKKAGVSLKSVSRVINSEPHVSAKLRDKVEAAIAALDYVPDMAARSLAGARSFMLSVLLDNPSPHYTMKVLAGAYRACLGHQYHLRLDNLDSSPGAPPVRDQLDQILRHGRIDGFILTPPTCDDPEVLDMLEARSQPYARMAPVLDPGRSLAVVIDDAAAAAAVADMLWARGHRAFGLINGPDVHGAASTRRQGFLTRLAQLAPGLEVAQAPGGFSFEMGIAAGLDLLTRRPDITAIFAANDDSAAGAMVACRQLGRDVPGDVSICGFDDSWVAKSVWPYLSTVYQPIEEMAHDAVELLLARDSSAGPVTRQLDFRLIERESVAAITPA